MAKIRIYELAKQLNMTNKVLLERLKEMNIAVKSHMSVIDEESIAGIKEALFQGKSEIVSEKRIKGTVIRRRKKVVEKKVEVEAITPVAKAEDEVPVKLKTKEALDVKPDQVVLPVSDEASKEKVAMIVEPDKPAAKTEVEIPKEAAPEPGKVEAKPEKARPAKKARVKKKPKTKKEQPAKIIKMPEVEPAVDIIPQEKPAAPAKAKTKAAAHLKLVPKEERPAAAKGKVKKKDKKSPVKFEEEKEFFKKKITFRKKEVLDKSDLYDEKALRSRKGRRQRKGKVAIKGDKTLITTPKAIKRRIKMRVK